MTDEIIDFEEYARRKREESEPARTMFAIWGGEGERTRFALPLWRAAGLVDGARATLGWERAEDRREMLRPLVVLDLGAEPARTEVPARAVDTLRESAAAPALAVGETAVVVFLGEDEGRRWYLVVDDLSEPPSVAGLPVEELHFLAGECAGLLFHRSLAESEEP